MTQTERTQARSQERRARQKEALRQQILDAAAALFLEQGYDGFSLRQVAERIGYSATTIYLFFKSREELLFTLADDGFTRFGAQIAEAATAHADPRARLVAIGRAYIDFGIKNPAYYRLMFVERADFLLAAREGEQQPRISALGIVAQTIQEGIDRGIFRDGSAPALADALWAAVHGVVTLAGSLPTMRDERLEATAQSTVQLMVTGLRR
jgi:AcrR family transcriptional regulator